MITLSELKRRLEGIDAYLVGGGALNVINNVTSLPRDWDILVNDGRDLPDFEEEPTRTSFGGRRYTGLKLDIWHGDIGSYLRRCPWHHKACAVHLETGAVIGTSEYFAGRTGDVTDRPTTLHPNQGPRWSSVSCDTDRTDVYPGLEDFLTRAQETPRITVSFTETIAGTVDSLRRQLAGPIDRSEVHTPDPPANFNGFVQQAQNQANVVSRIEAVMTAATRPLTWNERAQREINEEEDRIFMAHIDDAIAAIAAEHAQAEAVEPTT